MQMVRTKEKVVCLTAGWYLLTMKARLVFWLTLMNVVANANTMVMVFACSASKCAPGTGA